MTFNEIFRNVPRGSYVRRASWPDGKQYRVGRLMDAPSPQLTGRDFGSDDWETYEEGLDFLAAVTEMMKGNKIRRKCWPTGLHISRNPADEKANTFFFPYREAVNATDWEVID